MPYREKILALSLALAAAACSGDQRIAAPDAPAAPPAPPAGGSDSLSSRTRTPPMRPGYIHISDPDGTTIPLTPGKWPAWSPDGRKIAFEFEGRIHTINTDGTGEQRLAEGAYPSWSSDGARIVFTNREGIAVMGADGSAVATILRHDFRDDTYAEWDMGVGKPSWSPDGTRIVFEHFGDGDMEPAQIYIMGADGSAVRRLNAAVNGRRYAESDPSWSRDGSKIVFWSYGFGIAMTDSRGGEPVGIYRDFPNVAYGARPMWSADGRTLSFNTYKGSQAGPSIWTIGENGGGPSLLIPGAYDAAWSPVGARLAFVGAP